jgi:hypothetical protein
MATPERITQVKEAIIAHLELIGPYNWEEVQKDFLDISRASFWRYVSWAKRYLKEKLTHPGPPDLLSHVNLANDDDPSADPDPWAKQHLNATFRGLKQAERLHELYADVLALREQSLDDKGRIRDPAQFAKSIRLRQQLLDSEISVLDTVRGTDTSIAFFDKIVDVVAKASPEVAQEIMKALNELSNATQQNEGNAPP